jgi:hypothetical protein
MTFVVTSHGEPIGRWELARLDHQFFYAWGLFVPASAFDPLRPFFETAPDGLLLYDLFDEVRAAADAGDEESYRAFAGTRDALRLALQTPLAAVPGAHIVGITRTGGQDTWEMLVRTEGAAAFERLARLHYLHAPQTFAQYTHVWTMPAAREPSQADPALVQRAADVLARARKNNPVFLGPAGAARDQLVAATVGLLRAGGIETLGGWQVASLEVGALRALTTWDEASETLQAVVWQAYHASPRTLFVIDRLDLLVPWMSATLKPFLGRDQLRFIGTATFEDYRAQIETDATIHRRVQEILTAAPPLHSSAAATACSEGRYGNSC